MTEWRKIETVIVDWFRRSGFKIEGGGDTMAVTRPACLMAQIGEGACSGLADRSVNITALAQELSELVKESA
jgi:hypothetical protein